jgi:hypothetical protein
MEDWLFIMVFPFIQGIKCNRVTMEPDSLSSVPDTATYFVQSWENCFSYSSVKRN